jgi:hypothetical protein
MKRKAQISGGWMRPKRAVFESTKVTVQGGWNEYALIACSFLQVKKVRAIASIMPS